MSAFSSTKRKKYSWLPEANPSALSGNSTPVEQATGSSKGVIKDEKGGSKSRPSSRQRGRGSGRGKTRDKRNNTSSSLSKDASATTEDPLNNMTIDDLGIATTRAETPNSEEAATAAASEAAVGDKLPVEVDAEITGSTSGGGGLASPLHGLSTTQTKIRRRARKDSVDELVRNRIMSNMNAQNQSKDKEKDRKAGRQSNNNNSSNNSNGQTTRSRRRGGGEGTTSLNITASVRSALAQERSKNARESPLFMTASNNDTFPSTLHSSRQQRSNIYHHHHHHHHHTNNSNNTLSGISTPGYTSNPTTVVRTLPSPKLGPLETKYSFPALTPINQRSITSTMKRGDYGVGDHSQTNEFEVTTGENIVVIHPGSRWLRIGKASDAVPKEIPHVIARRVRKAPNKPNDTTRHEAPKQEKGETEGKQSDNSKNIEMNVGASIDDEKVRSDAQDSNDMDIDQPEPTSDNNPTENDDNDDNDDSAPEKDEGVLETADDVIKMLRDTLKQHQRQSKRKAPPNAYAQIASYNRQSKPEIIHDHNDPFKIEWISSSEFADDYVIGEKALHLADTEKFLIRYPICNGCLNVEDYNSIEEVLGDVETIWTSMIENDIGIKCKNLPEYGAVLIIPDIYNRVEVIALSEMLLRRMGFGWLLIQQSSTLVTFGAGFSTACVVDVGAQKASIACVEDGYCHPESRVNIKYGGDDITKFLFDLFTRSEFPYHEASLAHTYDWNMLNELRERYCTLNLSDVNIRVHEFFVRAPNERTRKYSFKTYDEMYQAPLCLFYPNITDEYHKLPDYSRSFINSIYPKAHAEAGSSSCSSYTVTQFGILPVRIIENTPQPDGAVPSADDPHIPKTMPGTPNVYTNTGSIPGTPGEKSVAARNSNTAKPAVEESSKTMPATPSVPSVSYIPDPTTQYTRMPLDMAITHSISHAGSSDKAKKFYASIVLVGGGISFIPGFDEVLASRLMFIRPVFMQGIERADIVSAPRDLDPRVLAWKGGAVLSRLECSREMWVSSQEWSDFGPKLLRDRLLFQW